MSEEGGGAPASQKLVLPAELWPAQISGDVITCLLSAMVATLPISRQEITPKTVPSKPPISADEGAWRRTLNKFEALLRAANPQYDRYRNKQIFARETLNLTVPKISEYLRQKVLEAIAAKVGA